MKILKKVRAITINEPSRILIEKLPKNLKPHFFGKLNQLMTHFENLEILSDSGFTITNIDQEITITAKIQQKFVKIIVVKSITTNHIKHIEIS